MMAGAEVTVSSGQLMKVKEEEGECSGNNHTTQVILHLHGINYDTPESGASDFTIETPQNNRISKGEEIEYGYPITCGNSRAVLLFKKFVCPGINVRCVKFNDQLISPKQFVHLAGKATLKDWKRAIRLGGVMLRKMMDSGQIDFYQHDSVCNNTCRSTKFDVINNTWPPPGTLMQPGLSCLALDPSGGQVPPSTGDVHNSEEVEGALKDRFSATAERSDGPPQPLKATTANGLRAKRKRVDMTDGVLGLWRAVADSGLMGEVLSSLQTELLTTFQGVELRGKKANLQETDALILHSLCEMFGLLDSVKQAVDMRRSQTKESKTQNSVYALDDILEGEGKRTCNRNRSDQISSLEHVGYHHQSQMNSCNQNQLLSTVIHPLSVTGYSASHAQLFTEELNISKIGNQLGEEDTAGMHKKIGERTVKFLQDSQIRSEELEAKNGTKRTQNSIIKRKPSEKRKSK
ncbi:glucocorticoid modulatory element-binding protein 1-like [Cololabis saira]|uniref:glucocorticoid modulatory element-binding protein 1-like n=1 Tax=Cololabis saira TaxID=129043 RepID=UPI002AD4BAA5|nr:glucocorticoid modulatory element-binding protein 1-like [Cololabis saira]XP_061574286.1 glucocorticoid modulatory element-binding protein 1-like [Cololabis saira]